MGIRPDMQGRPISSRLCQRNVAPGGARFKAYHRLVEFPQYLVVSARMEDDEAVGARREQSQTDATCRRERHGVDLDVRTKPGGLRTQSARVPDPCRNTCIEVWHVLRRHLR